MDALLRKIYKYKSKKDIAIVEHWISISRMNARKCQSDFVRYWLNREANTLERKLKFALLEYPTKKVNYIDKNARI
jgi:hypothetical protein